MWNSGVSEWAAKFLRRLKNTSPFHKVLAAVSICVLIAWCILGLLMQLKWADWLFIPMFCVAGALIIVNFRERKPKWAISSISSLIALVLLAIPRVLGPSSTWINTVCLILIVILLIVSAGLLEDEDHPPTNADNSGS